MKTVRKYDEGAALLRERHERGLCSLCGKAPATTTVWHSRLCATCAERVIASQMKATK